MHDMPVFDPCDDRPQRPGRDDGFEDSVVLVWRDDESGLGGYFRIGQRPLADRQSACLGIFTRDGLRFRTEAIAVPLAPGDRDEGGMAWGRALRFDCDRQELAIDLPDCEGRLRVEDFHPRYDYNALAGLPRESPPGTGHFAVAGRIVGRLRIGTQEIAVNALGYRDRSWGPRDWNAAWEVRWWQMVFGPDLVAGIAAVGGRNGDAAFGYVIRDGIPHTIRAAEMDLTFDREGLSPSGGQTHLLFGESERASIFHTPGDGIFLKLGGGESGAVQSVGTARWGDRTGMSNIEVMKNRRGLAAISLPHRNINASMGLSLRPLVDDGFIMISNCDEDHKIRN